MAWRRLSKSFKSCSVGLCDALAGVARRICTTLVDPSSLTSFIGSCLIALDKCPGVRPVGISDVARRIIGKAIVRVIGNEIKKATGPLQTCADVLDIYPVVRQLFTLCIKCLKIRMRMALF